MTSADPLNVVYVASIGRSGSTLLESMLGAHSRVATIGEMHLWPHELRDDVRPCACGRSIHDCPFWTEVRGRVDPLAQVGPGLDFFREHHDGGRTLRPDHLRDFRWDKVPTRGTAQDTINAYGANNFEAMSAFRDVFAQQQGKQVQWVVDASKDPYRLAWLKRARTLRSDGTVVPTMNLRTVHLVKDPRAYIYSIMHDQDSRRRKLYMAARQSGAWLTQNLLLADLDRHLLDGDALVLRYEDFATDPAGVFEQVCAYIGIEFEPDAVVRFREGSVHTIAGNPMRYESRPIALDERWREGLPRTSRLVVDAVTGAFRHRFGY